MVSVCVCDLIKLKETDLTQNTLMHKLHISSNKKNIILKIYLLNENR